MVSVGSEVLPEAKLMTCSHAHTQGRQSINDPVAGLHTELLFIYAAKATITEKLRSKRQIRHIKTGTWAFRSQQ